MKTLPFFVLFLALRQESLAKKPTSAFDKTYAQ